ncbi:MAG: hypothetical protein HZA50_14245 [Planctomycetes bacterium]|nr:hypothetical protein [Planctomycetota bacterium]
MIRLGKMLPAWCCGTWVAICCCGCLPTDMPAYVNDGKIIVTDAWDDSARALWTYDVQNKTVEPHVLSEEWHLSTAKMLGDQVWTEWEKKKENAKADDLASFEYTTKRFDPVKNEFVSGPKELEGQEWLGESVVASYEGKKCIFLPKNRFKMIEDKIKYDVLTLPDFKKEATVSFDMVIPAGRFWWISLAIKKIETEKKGTLLEIQQIDIFNQEGKKVVSIPNEEGRKIEYFRKGPPGHARISDDGKVLLLAVGKLGYCNFGVFDVEKGKYLWGGNTRTVIFGNPVVKSTEIWALELEKLKKIMLVRYTQGEKADECKRNIIFEYQLKEAVRTQTINFLTPMIHYAASPDDSQFVVTVNGKTPKLLFIPVRKDATEKDVVAVELKAATAPAK